MPVYDYKCPSHGVFNELASMDKAALPAVCPQCQSLSPRILMIPPEVLAMAPAKRAATARNEAAQHQPVISSIDSRAEKADRLAFQQKKQHRHSKQCGCSENHNSSLRQQAVLLPDGSKIFPSQRPWMISH